MFEKKKTNRRLIHENSLILSLAEGNLPCVCINITQVCTRLPSLWAVPAVAAAYSRAAGEGAQPAAAPASPLRLEKGTGKNPAAWP